MLWNCGENGSLLCGSEPAWAQELPREHSLEAVSETLWNCGRDCSPSMFCANNWTPHCHSTVVVACAPSVNTGPNFATVTSVDVRGKRSYAEGLTRTSWLTSLLQQLQPFRTFSNLQRLLGGTHSARLQSAASRAWVRGVVKTMETLSPQIFRGT